MLAFIRTLFAALLLVIGHAFAATVQDEHGTFTLDKTPQRIVVLELSFADALAAVDVSPIGIADDNDAKRILPEVRAHLKPWQSVGTRAQPSLEAIAALKPDLIIADSSRHAGIYSALQQIAPVLLLKSRNETYAENLQSAAIIGEVVGKKQRCRRVWNNIKKDGAVGQPVATGHAWPLAHHANSYSTCIRRDLDRQRAGFSGAERSRCDGGRVHAVHRPGATAGGQSCLAAGCPLSRREHRETLATRPLWQILTAAQKQQVASVDSNAWARMRGIFAAERIAATR
jgi:iron complex transport system substrate-binding protein